MSSKQPKETKTKTSPKGGFNFESPKANWQELFVAASKLPKRDLQDLVRSLVGLSGVPNIPRSGIPKKTGSKRSPKKDSEKKSESENSKKSSKGSGSTWRTKMRKARRRIKLSKDNPKGLKTSWALYKKLKASYQTIFGKSYNDLACDKDLPKEPLDK
jgi:hypothetical protein